MQGNLEDNMVEIAESIRQHGVLVPAVVRPKENGRYEMVAGHRRKMACSLIAHLHIPCIVRELTDEEATVIMVDSNLQREQILPSEKAFAYKMKLDAMRRQAGRPSKENIVPLGHHFIEGKSTEILAENSPDSNTQIQRYIRLTSLSVKAPEQQVLSGFDGYDVVIPQEEAACYISICSEAALKSLIFTNASFVWQ